MFTWGFGGGQGRWPWQGWRRGVGPSFDFVLKILRMVIMIMMIAMMMSMRGGGAIFDSSNFRGLGWEGFWLWYVIVIMMMRMRQILENSEFESKTQICKGARDYLIFPQGMNHWYLAVLISLQKLLIIVDQPFAFDSPWNVTFFTSSVLLSQAVFMNDLKVYILQAENS